MNKNKKLTAKIILLSFCFSFLLVFSPLNAPKTYAWDATLGAVVDNLIGTLREQILGIIMGAAKKAAVSMVMDKVSELMGDSSETGEKFITDWKDYLQTTPDKAAKKYMNDYLSGITKGTDSSRYTSTDSTSGSSTSLNYEGFGGMNEYQFALIQSAKAGSSTSSETTSGEKYTTTLKNMKDAITASDDEKKPEITCTDEERNNMFAKGFDAFWKCTEGINYAPLAYAQLRAKYEMVKTLEKDAQTLKALASGYLPAMQNGKVITPAGTIAAIQDRAATLSMENIPNAKNPGEVITAAVTQIIGDVINKGIGDIKDQNQRDDSSSKNDTQNKNDVQTSGPQSLFKNN